MSDLTYPLWKQDWKRHGIRYLGKNRNAHVDAMDRFEHAWLMGYQAGIMAQARDFELPEGAHVAALAWNNQEAEG